MAADAVDLALREDAQDPGLGLGRHVADLVEEERAAVGGLELAGAGVDPGRDAAFDPEELALEQVAGQRSAVEGHQRFVRPVGGGVEIAREQLFAGARLAADEHADPAPGDPRRLIVDLSHGRDQARRVGRARRFAVLALAPTFRILAWPRGADQRRGGAEKRLKRVRQGRAGKRDLELDAVARRDRDLGGGVGALALAGEDDAGATRGRQQNLDPSARQGSEQRCADRPGDLVAGLASGDPLDELRQVPEAEGLEDGGTDGRWRIFDGSDGGPGSGRRSFDGNTRREIILSHHLDEGLDAAELDRAAGLDDGPAR